MQIMNRLTLIHLKQNKKRTLVTMLGIIISVAMITAVGAGYTSALNYLQEYTVQYAGRWHVAYKGKLSEEPKYPQNVKLKMLEKEMGYADFSKSINEDKPYVFLYAYETTTFKEMPLTLKEGRFPSKDSEIVLSQHMMDNGGADYQIGDKLTLNMGKRYGKDEAGNEQVLQQDTPYQSGSEEGQTKENFRLSGESKTYTVVGIVERPGLEPYSAPGYSAFTYLDKTKLNPEDEIIHRIYFKPVKFKQIEHYEKDSSFVLNKDLLRNCGFSGNDSVSQVFVIMGTILMGIIMMGTVCLIYNAFAISATDRSKEFGMLASVGATRKQKRNAVLMEATVMSAICIPIGILSGLTGIGITFRALGKYFRWAIETNIPMTLSITWSMIGIVLVLALLTIFISAWIPAKRASSMSAIEAVTMRKDYSYSAASLKTPKAVRKIFGFEGELALKNLKRNKKQYRAMTFSLMMTFVLFTTLSTYTNLVTKTYDTVRELSDYNISITMFDQNEKDKQVYEALKNVKGVEKSNFVQRAYFPIYMNRKEFLELASDEILNLLEDEDMAARFGLDIKDEKFRLDTILYVLEEKEMENYAKEVGLTKAQYENMAADDVIVVNHKKTVRDGYYATYKMLNVSENSKLQLDVTSYDVEDSVMKWKPKVVKATEVYPMGTKESESASIALSLVMSRKGLEQFIDKYNQHFNTNTSFTDVVNSFFYFDIHEEDALEIQEDMEQILNKKLPTDSYSLYNAAESKGRNRAMNVIVQVFADGFIVLISLICIANLCNTIATSFELRRREFAMLKSVGMEKKKFNRMICYESMFYGLKALLYGIPISLFVIMLIFKGLSILVYTAFQVPLLVYSVAILGIIIIISIGMFYASRKITKENIMDGLRMQ